MISINTLVVSGFNSDYIDDFKRLYNVNLINFNHYTFIMDLITNDPNICIQSDYKVICKNGQKFSLVYIENQNSSIINDIIKTIKIKLNVQRLYLGGLFFCSFNDEITDFNQDTFNKLIYYLTKELKMSFRNNLIYGLCDVERKVSIFFCNSKFYKF